MYFTFKIHILVTTTMTWNPFIYKKNPRQLQHQITNSPITCDPLPPPFFWSKIKHTCLSSCSDSCRLRIWRNKGLSIMARREVRSSSILWSPWSHSRVCRCSTYSTACSVPVRQRSNIIDIIIYSWSKVKGYNFNQLLFTCIIANIFGCKPVLAVKE